MSKTRNVKRNRSPIASMKKWSAEHDKNGEVDDLHQLFIKFIIYLSHEYLPRSDS